LDAITCMNVTPSGAVAGKGQRLGVLARVEDTPV
jgi:hypothetical protein